MLPHDEASNPVRQIGYQCSTACLTQFIFPGSNKRFHFCTFLNQVSSGDTLVSRDTRGRSAVRNSQLYTLEQSHKDSTFGK